MYTAASMETWVLFQNFLTRTLYLSLGEGEYGVTDMLYAAARSKSSEVLLVFGEGEYGGAHWGYTFSLQVRDDEQGCSCC